MTPDRQHCRRSGCERTARGGGGFAGRFCSTPCELEFEHVRADAREARRDTEREAEEVDGL